MTETDKKRQTANNEKLAAIRRKLGTDKRGTFAYRPPGMKAPRQESQKKERKKDAEQEKDCRVKE